MHCPLLLLLSAAVTPPPATAAPKFLAHSTAATPATGTLRSLGEDGAVALAEPDGAVAAGGLVSLRRADRPLPQWPRGPQAILTNGDRIGGDAVGGGDDDLALAPAGAWQDRRAAWPVPVGSLAAVWVTAPPADAPADPRDYPWAGTTARRDAVLLRNGDVLRGVIEGFTPAPAVRLKPDGDAAVQVLDLTRVAAIAFDPSLARPRSPKATYYRLVTAGGSRLSLKSATATAAMLHGETLFGAKVALPLAEVVALDVYLGKATYLSDLKPKGATADGFNGVAWPPVADRTVRGGPLRLRTPLGEATFDKGLGTHSRTTLTYALAAKHKRFEATVGLDAVSGRKGAAAVRVLVDGRVAWQADRLTAADRPRAVSVDVAGARELTLLVDYGTGGDVQDDVNWGDARLTE